MNPQKKMVYMQKLFNPSQYRSNGLSTLTKENFARVMIESINKAINSNESPVKEKHVRKLLIGSYQAESGSFFWQYLPVIRLKENQIVCWKFCHVLHKMLRDGHRQVLHNSYERRQILLDCGNMWRHVEDGYGQLIFKYCTLLYNRINFLVRNPRFPNDLKVTDEQLDEAGGRDINIFFDLSCEIFDALDDILRLQELVLVTLDLKKYNSMTSSGQCHLAPLLSCIQDSSLLYDYSVKILFKLHNGLPASTLEGHRDRFLCQHRALKNFYINTSNLQYFKTLIQIPHLTDRPPNFLNAFDIHQHVTPQVVMIANPERDSPDQFNSTTMNTTSSSNASQSGDSGGLLVNISDDFATIAGDSESVDSQSVSAYASASNDDSIDAIIMSNRHFGGQSGELSADASKSSLESSLLLRERNDSLTSNVQALEAIISDLKHELELEKASHASTKESLKRELEQAKSKAEEQVKAHSLELKKVKDDLANLRYQMNPLKSSLEKAQEECKRAQHDNEISQGAMKKLVKDFSDLKTENANLRAQRAAAPPPQATLSTSQLEAAKAQSDQRIDELSRQVNELQLQLGKRDNQYQDFLKERERLMSTNVRLEKQLDTQQEDLLMAEMNETDKIIKEATKRIEELSANSRKLETGIKLQVNEKISEVCSNLMKAVRNLIIQSRLLQREIVADNGGGNITNSSEFYKQNSSWTEGLISAANVVAMAARSLVEAADRTMSGQAKFSELAAAAHEISAATSQLVCASRVKANKDSEKLKILTTAAKQVNQCTGHVVDTARVCAELIEQEIDSKIDISTLSLHQTKKLEMETQVKLLELEDRISKERIRLGLLRRQHYEQEEAQLSQE